MNDLINNKRQRFADSLQGKSRDEIIDAVELAVRENGGALTRPNREQRWASDHECCLKLHGICAQGANITEAIHNWVKCVERASDGSMFEHSATPDEIQRTFQ